MLIFHWFPPYISWSSSHNLFSLEQTPFSFVMSRLHTFVFIKNIFIKNKHFY